MLRSTNPPPALPSHGLLHAQGSELAQQALAAGPDGYVAAGMGAANMVGASGSGAGSGSVPGSRASPVPPATIPSPGGMHTPSRMGPAAAGAGGAAGPGRLPPLGPSGGSGTLGPGGTVGGAALSRTATGTSASLLAELSASALQSLTDVAAAAGVRQVPGGGPAGPGPLARAGGYQGSGNLAAILGPMAASASMRRSLQGLLSGSMVVRSGGAGAGAVPLLAPEVSVAAQQAAAESESAMATAVANWQPVRSLRELLDYKNLPQVGGTL